MAVKLGYRNVFRDPQGFPDGERAGIPVERTPAGLDAAARAPDSPGPLHGWAMLGTLLAIFLGGVALNLTPCVYPMIPVTVSFFGGRAAAGSTGRGRLAAHGACYLLGLALMNSVLGAAAALTGSLLGSALQHPAVLIAVAGVMLLFAASLFGLWELRLPGVLTQAAAASYGGYFGSFFMGLTLGVIAAPCIGPFVIGLLTWVAGLGSPWLGFLVFFALSLGLGLPLAVLAVFSGQLKRLPRAGGWMIGVRRAMGWVMVGMAVHFLRPVLPGAWGSAALAATALAAGVHLGWRGRSPEVSRAFAWIRAAALAASWALAAFLLATAWLQGPGVSWTAYSDAALAEARRLKRPAIIDFYAAWCAPCRELDEITFHDARVRQAGEAFAMFKVDVTRGGNPVHERLLRDLDVKGVPTVVFMDAEGRERPDLRVVDYLPPDQFFVRMQQLIPGSGQ